MSLCFEEKTRVFVLREDEGLLSSRKAKPSFHREDYSLHFNEKTRVFIFREDESLFSSEKSIVFFSTASRSTMHFDGWGSRLSPFFFVLPFISEDPDGSSYMSGMRLIILFKRRSQPPPSVAHDDVHVGHKSTWV